jgi:hypothetical protein
VPALGACVNATFNLVEYLVDEGVREFGPEVFTVPVLANTSVEIKRQVYSAELGVEVPTDLSRLDPKVWRPIHEDIELLPLPKTTVRLVTLRHLVTGGVSGHRFVRDRYGATGPGKGA